MDLKAVFLANLVSERRLTRETIALIPEHDLHFAPTPEQMRLGAQALHIVSCQETLLEALNGRGWNWQRNVDLDHIPTCQAILDRFDAMHVGELAFYQDLEIEEMQRQVHTSWGSRETVLQLGIAFLAHEAHHRGQMVVYLRLRGVKPPKY